MVLQCDWAQIQVVVLTNDGNGFGFGISGSRNSGAVVRNIFPGGAADRDGTLRNGDHLLAVGDVRLWGMGAEQVAAILRQAGQDSIRLVVARPVDPSVPQFALNSTIVPTKVLTDPQGLDQALRSGLQQAVNGYPFDQASGAAANGAAYPEAYQSIMDVMPSEMPSVAAVSTSAMMGFTSAETMVVPSSASLAAAGPSATADNIALPPSTKSIIEPSDTIVTHLSSKSNPLVTVVSSCATSVSSEAVIQIHNNEGSAERGHRVAIVASQNNPNKVSIIHCDENKAVVQETMTEEEVVPDENCINEANKMPPSTLTSTLTINSPLKAKVDLLEVPNTEADKLPEKEEYSIELSKDHHGLGITIAGYVCEKEDLCGIFVKNVIEGSIADKSGSIMVNDQITEVDGTSLSGRTNQEAVDILKKTGNLVTLKIVRYLRGLKFEELQDGIKAANASTPTSPYPPTPNEAAVTSSELDTQPIVSSSAEATSTASVTVSSLSRPSSCSSSQCLGPSTSTHLARGSPLSKSLKHPVLPTAAASASVLRRSVPNVHEECSMLQENVGGNSSTSTIVQDDKDALQLKWEAAMGTKYTIVIAKLRKPDASSGLGISLEGTVDVEDGKEVRPHHYIRSILPGGPIGLNGVLRSGDELLEVNGKCLKGLYHEEVVKSLKELPVDVCLVCGRKVTGPSPLRGTIVDNVDTGRSEQAFASRKILSGSLQSLLASKEPELLLKAKSEVSLVTTSQSLSVELSTATLSHLFPLPEKSTQNNQNTDLPSSNKKSQSLDHLSQVAMWKTQVEQIVLHKSDKGLGFSILDYQDPLNTMDTVIVVRSLVPGGVAQVDGRIVPGDRIIYVNQIQLERASLDTAVQALKGAAYGPVNIGIARPVTEDKMMMNELRSRLTSNEDNGNIETEKTEDESDIGRADEEESLNESSSVLSRPGEFLPIEGIQILPHLPKYSVCIKKGPSGFLGLQLEALAFELCGTLIRQIEEDSCVDRDGRLRPGDLILYLNHECLWRVTSSQAKTVLRRAELVSNAIPIVFVPEEKLVPSEDTTEEDSSQEDFSESLKLSEIQEESTLHQSSPEEIQPDLTVQSGAARLTRFPSDLLESSVDPQPTSAHSQVLTPRDFQETSTLNMVRVYQPPPVSNSRGQTLPSSGQQPLNGYQASASAGSDPGKVWGPERVVKVTKEAGVSLGISIVGGKVDGGSSGIFIKNVIPDSPAGRAGGLFTGDRVLQVAGVALTSSEQNVAVEAIKNSQNPIQFVVQSLRPKRSACRVTELEVLDQVSRLSADPFQQNRRLSETNYMDLKNTSRITSSHIIETHSIDLDHHCTTSNSISITSSNLDDNNPFQNDQLPLWQQQPQKPKSNSHRDSPPNVSSPENNNYGNQHQAYKYKSLNETPTSPELANHRGLSSPPHTPTRSPEIIQPGLSDVERQKMQQKLDAEIKEKREEHLTVLKKNSLDRGDEDHFEMQSSVVQLTEDGGLNSKNLRDLKKEEAESSDEEEDQEIIDDDINRSENFAKLQGDVVEIEIKRNDFGFGLALAGHSNRNRMGTFICGIHPQGAAFENGQLKVGDELLKIHKTVVRGRCHLNVSAIMKKVPNDATVKIVALRHANNMEKIAVKKFTQFPVKLDDVIFDSPEFEVFLGKREIKMQKTTEGLGIMIIEGSHKVLGKGIFISDIQQKSLAFKAELRVGDMILAVNTESFLDITYDEAALILKQVTGNVRILVANPKEEEERRTAAAAEKQNKPAAQPATAGQPTAETPAVASAIAEKSTLSPNRAVTAEKSPAKTESKSPAKSPAKADAKSPAKSPAKKDDNTIELKKDANGLGIGIVGGSDTPLGRVIVHEVYKNGAADKDGRIKAGDFIVSVDGKILKDCTHKDALRALRVTKDKVKIVIDPNHDSTDLYQDIEVELLKKPGKGLGLSVVGRRDGNGVFISDMVVGGTAEMNGQLLRGDQIVSVNEADLSEAKQDQAVAILKTAAGSVKIKVRRYKCVASSS